jgi:hypothetical protein
MSAPSRRDVADRVFAEDAPSPAGGKFDVSVFLVQLVIQVFHPFSGVVVWPVFGSGAVFNMGFIPRRGTRALNYLIFAVYGLSALACFVLWLTAPEGSGPTGDGAESEYSTSVPPALAGVYSSTLQADALFAMCSFFFHRVAVAFKYAYMPPALYGLLMRKLVPVQVLLDEQMTSGWVPAPVRLIAREVERTAAEAVEEDVEDKLFHYGYVEGAAPVAPTAGGGAAGGARRASLPSLGLSPPEVSFSLTLEQARRLYQACCEDAKQPLVEMMQQVHREEKRMKGGAVDELQDFEAGQSARPTTPEPVYVAVRPTDMATVLIVQATNATAATRKKLLALAVVSGTLLFLLPTILRAAVGLPAFGATIRDTCVIVLSLVSCRLFIPLTFVFLSACALDHLRRAKALELLGRLVTVPGKGRGVLDGARGVGTGVLLIRASSRARMPRSPGGGPGWDDASSTPTPMASPSATFPSPSPSPSVSTPFGPDGSESPPCVSLDSIAQTRAWLFTRQLILRFGMRFHARAVAIVSLGLVLFTIVAALYVAYLFGASKVGDGGSGSPSLAINAVLFHAVTIPPFVFAATALYHGAEVNAGAARHASLLVRHRIAALVAGLQSAQAGTAAATAAAPEACGTGDLLPLGPLARSPVAGLTSLMEAIERSVLAEAAEDPVRILGFEATPALTQSFLGAWLSLETAALTIIASKFGVSSML